jgi:hypothetical protein
MLIVPFAKKKIDKNKFNDRKKLSVVLFDRAMSNVYENIIFSLHLPVIWWRFTI